MAVAGGILPDRYANPRLIGRGGMGEIYLAEDTELGRRVAVKVLDPRFAHDESLRTRFKREALAAARLSGDPHIVTIFDVGEWQGRPLIVMEYLAGGTLADRAREEGIEREQALGWLEQAAAALDAAQGRGIVHRDVKPANLLLDERGDVHVADFGIARVADDTGAGVTAAGTVLGTAGYLSPEQARGEPATAASDRYALGVVAYELLTGGRPFEGGSATAEAAAHIHQPVPPASERGVGLNRSVDSVFDQALAKDPARRYRTAAAFVGALRAALQPAEETTRTRVLPAAAAPPEPRRRTRGVLPALLTALLLLALLGGAVAAALLTREDGEEASPREQAPPEVTVTQEQTETLPGTTVVETATVVTTVSAPSGGSGEGGGDISVDEAVDLTDRATAALGRGDWDEARRLARRAYPALEGTYRDDFRYEAYVNYNFGKALVELDRCGQALPYLELSEDLQGERGEITAAKEECGAA
jgi:predicted Ser/Thr protein kinase